MNSSTKSASVKKATTRLLGDSSPGSVGGCSAPPDIHEIPPRTTNHINQNVEFENAIESGIRDRCDRIGKTNRVRLSRKSTRSARRKYRAYRSWARPKSA